MMHVMTMLCRDKGDDDHDAYSECDENMSMLILARNMMVQMMMMNMMMVITKMIGGCEWRGRSR